MGIDALLGQKVTVHRRSAAAGTDDYNDPVTQEDQGTEYQGFLEQTQSVEVLVDRDTVVSDWLLVLPATAQISSQDKVVEGGRSFEVVGHPLEARTPAGIHHIEARLRIVEG